MRLSDLRDKQVRSLDGQTIGRVHDVHVDGGRVIALMCGAGGFLERLTGKKGGRRIAWESVERVDGKAITVALDRPRGKSRRP